MREDARTFIRCAPAVQYTSPALLFVPLPADLSGRGFDPATMADESGPHLPRVAWVIGEAHCARATGVGRASGCAATRQGFLVALADVAPGVLGRGAIGDLMPSFVILDPAYTDYVSTGIGRAQSWPAFSHIAPGSMRTSLSAASSTTPPHSA